MAMYSPTDSGANTPMSPVENFESNVEKKFTTMTNRQDSVQTLSLWCIHHKSQCQKVAAVWYKVLKKSKFSHRLTLFYLVNDIVQNCKRKNAKIYLLAFKSTLKEAMILLREQSVRSSVERILNIWDERKVFRGAFVEELKDLLADTKKLTTAHTKIIKEFKPQELIDGINSFKRFEAEVELKQKQLSNLRLDASDLEAVKQLKDKTHGREFSKQFEESCSKIENFVLSLQKEVKDKTQLIELFEKSELFYETQYGEAKIVANAYKNFGTRINNLKKRLADHKKSLPSPLNSPCQSPSLDAPSPGNTPPPDPSQDNIEEVDMEMSDSESEMNEIISAKSIKSVVTKPIHSPRSSTDNSEKEKSRKRSHDSKELRKHSSQKSAHKDKSKSKSGHHRRSSNEHRNSNSVEDRLIGLLPSKIIKEGSTKTEELPVYKPPPVKRHQKRTQDEAGSTPTQDEPGDSESSNPMDFIAKFLHKSQKLGQAGTDFLQKLLTKSVENTGNKEKKQAISWADYKAKKQEDVSKDAVDVTPTTLPAAVLASDDYQPAFQVSVQNTTSQTSAGFSAMSTSYQSATSSEAAPVQVSASVHPIAMRQGFPDISKPPPGFAAPQTPPVSQPQPGYSASQLPLSPPPVGYVAPQISGYQPQTGYPTPNPQVPVSQVYPSYPGVQLPVSPGFATPQMPGSQSQPGYVDPQTPGTQSQAVYQQTPLAPGGMHSFQPSVGPPGMNQQQMSPPVFPQSQSSSGMSHQNHIQHTPQIPSLMGSNAQVQIRHAGQSENNTTGPLQSLTSPPTSPIHRQPAPLMGGPRLPGPSILRSRSNSNNVEIKTVETSTPPEMVGVTVTSYRPHLVRPPPNPPTSADKPSVTQSVGNGSSDKAEFIEKLKRRSSLPGVPPESEIPKPNFPNQNNKIVEVLSQNTGEETNLVHVATQEHSESDDPVNQDKNNLIAGNKISTVGASAEPVGLKIQSLGQSRIGSPGDNKFRPIIRRPPAEQGYYRRSEAFPPEPLYRPPQPDFRPREPFYRPRQSYPPRERGGFFQRRPYYPGPRY